jgi:hypothetical protein
LIPELAEKLNAMSESIDVWLRRYMRTGARFDPVDWARKAMWWTKGSMTFKEAYEVSDIISRGYISHIDGIIIPENRKDFEHLGHSSSRFKPDEAFELPNCSRLRYLFCCYCFSCRAWNS